MQPLQTHRLVNSLFPLLAALLFGCGGDRNIGPAKTVITPPAAVASNLSGVVSAGLFANAVVNVFDANTYVEGANNTVIATAVTASDGSYRTTLPLGFSKTILIRANGKADNSSFVKDEVFGQVSVTESFLIQAIIPASDVTGKDITANVTPFTHAMATFVARKLGQADLDKAIVLARAQVKETLTMGLDPLTTSPLNSTMLTLLASVSNIAKTAQSTDATDPYYCAGKALPAEKISCTIKTASATLQPIQKLTAPGSTATINFSPISALSNAATNLDTALVATNTGMSNTELKAKKTEVVNALNTTKTTAQTSLAESMRMAAFWIKENMTGRLDILSGPTMGSYQGWSYQAQLCSGGYNCISVGPPVEVSAQDQIDDKEILGEAQKIIKVVLAELGQLLRDMMSAKIIPPQSVINSVIDKAIRDGLAAKDVAVGLNSAKAGFAAAGFPVEGVGSSGTAQDTPPGQMAAAKECIDIASYQNPTAVPFDPQVDSNCRMAQVNACFHEKVGSKIFDAEGRANCSIVKTLMETLEGSWNCNKYCPYPY
jgi:hypothetical protein